MTLTTDQDHADQLEFLLRELVQTRKNQGLTQKDVARTMKVGQPSVSEFESGKTTPKISTIQRYARAVGAHVSFVVHAPETDDGQ